MPLHRRLVRTVTIAPPAPGFAGPGHLAAEVLKAEDFASNDPFILLMDDHLDIGNNPVGGAHPHAGFETVTLLLEGSVRDRYEGGVLEAGDVQWMTAGRGIIHGENVQAVGKVRLLQLWLTLPKSQRRTDPTFQDVPLRSAPVRREDGVEVRVYSGGSGGQRSPTRNQVPVTLAELRMHPGARLEQDLPASYNGFLYVLEGSAGIGEEAAPLHAGQVGWLDRPASSGVSVVTIVAGKDGARLVLYAGQPTGDPIVSHGPFIGDSREDIVRLHHEYRAGQFPRMSDITRTTRASQ